MLVQIYYKLQGNSCRFFESLTDNFVNSTYFCFGTWVFCVQNCQSTLAFSKFDANLNSRRLFFITSIPGKGCITFTQLPDYLSFLRCSKVCLGLGALYLAIFLLGIAVKALLLLRILQIEAFSQVRLVAPQLSDYLHRTKASLE